MPHQPRVAVHRARDGRYDGHVVVVDVIVVVVVLIVVVDAEGVQAVVFGRLVCCRDGWPCGVSTVAAADDRGCCRAAAAAAVGRAPLGRGKSDQVVDGVEEARLDFGDGSVRCEIVAIVGYVGDGGGGKVAG